MRCSTSTPGAWIGTRRGGGTNCSTAQQAGSGTWAGLGAPESVSSLREALALDTRLRVLVAHGLFDLVTPYFATRLIFRQIPESVGGDRVRFVTYPGGHMFYTVDASRAALRDAMRALSEAR